MSLLTASEGIKITLAIVILDLSPTRQNVAYLTVVGMSRMERG
jgi:hypothetical protein